MSEAGEGQGLSGERLAGKSEYFSVRLRGPVFDFIADKMTPVYLGELAKLKEDGAYKPLVQFYDSPFAMVAARILDRVDDNPRSPEIVEFEFSQDEYDAILKRIPEEKDFVRSRISRELKDEFKANFRDAKYTARLKNVTSKAVKKIRRKKK